MEFTNLTLIYGLFNQYVFSEAKMNIDYVMMYYKDKYIYNSNTLITKLLNLIRDYNYSDLTESRFLLVLQQDNKTEAESKEIYNKIHQFQCYSKDQASVFIENLRQLCSTAYQSRVYQRYQDNSMMYIEEIKKFNYKSNYSNELVAKNFSQLNITDLVSRYAADGFRSRYEFINKAYTCNGYIPGQIVIVCAAPSVGKSLFMQSEAVNFIEQGKRVHYLTMGDLNELDMAIRMMCQISHKSQRQIESDILGNFELYQPLFSDKLTLTVVPSGSVSAFDYVEWIKQRIDDFDVLFIDYDSNFAQDEAQSMYERGGGVYDAISELSRLGKLVFVATQPKQSYFGEEFLPYDAVGESSRKVHIADMIITIGRRWESSVPMGIFNIAKLRRGNDDCEKTAKYIRTNDGLFYCCSDALYAKYRSNKSQKARFSYTELESMDIIDSAISDVMPKSLNVVES